MKYLCLFLSLCVSEQLLAAHQDFFEVTRTDTGVSIKTTPSNHTYLHAGIKIKTSGLGFDTTNQGCQIDPASGYCIFSVYTLAKIKLHRVYTIKILNNVYPLFYVYLL